MSGLIRLVFDLYMTWVGTNPPFVLRPERRRAFRIRFQNGSRGAATETGFPDARAGNRIVNPATARRSNGKAVLTSTGWLFDATRALHRNYPCDCRQSAGLVFFGTVKKIGNVVRRVLAVAVQHEHPGEAEFPGPRQPARNAAPLPQFLARQTTSAPAFSPFPPWRRSSRRPRR